MAGSLSARYEAAAPHWGRRLEKLGFPAAYRAIVAEAVQRLGLPAGPISAIDLGAGDGAFAEALSGQLGPRLSLALLDRSAAMLRAAKHRLGPTAARFTEGDLDCPDLRPDSHDIVSAAHLLEHLPDTDAALARMGALLKPGGILILVVSRPHWCSNLVWLGWRHRRFRAAEIRDALGRAGFVEVQCWQPASGPPRRLSLAYAARRPVSG